MSCKKCRQPSEYRVVTVPLIPAIISIVTFLMDNMKTMKRYQLKKPYYKS